MEDETYHVRPSLIPSASSDYVVQMDHIASTTTSTPSPPLHPTAPAETDSNNTTATNNSEKPLRKNSVDAYYPYHSQSSGQHASVEVDVLKAYLQHEDEKDLDPDFNKERRMTAKLDDLLESAERASFDRRMSLYGENVKVRLLYLARSGYLLSN